MSVRRMRQVLHERSRTVAYIITFVFIIGLPLVFVPGRFGLGGPEDEGRQPPPEDVMAVANGVQITRGDLDREFSTAVANLLQFSAQFGQPVGVERLWRFRLEALDQAISRQLLSAKARESGFRVSGKEVRQYVEQMVEQEITQYKNFYQGEKLEQHFGTIVSRTEGREKDRMNEKSFRKWLIDRALEDSEEFETDLLIQKLEQQITGSVTATEQELRASYDEATVRELWVSLHPMGGTERTKEEALERAEELLARARSGEDFEELVRSESDAPDAQDTGGLVEDMRRGRLSEEWDEAVFSLAPGDISDPTYVDARSGYLIARLENTGRTLPEDFDQEKDALLTTFVRQEQREAWLEYGAELRDEADVEFKDPEIQAYRAWQEGDADGALEKLEEASAGARDIGGVSAASVFYLKATLLAARNQWEDAVEAYAYSSDALSHEDVAMPGARAQALMGMGRSYENMAQVEDAVLWYRAASDATGIPSIHEQLLRTFERLGEEDLAQAEQQWLDDYRRAEEERRKALEEQQRAMEEEEQPLPKPVVPEAEPE